MITNIALTGFNREKLKKIGKTLADALEMLYVDTIELYEFDHIPHSMTDMLKAQGVKEFRDKEVGTIGYVTDFSNTVITFETGAVKNKKNINLLKERCELVYLYEDLINVKTLLESQKYPSKQLKNFFNVKETTLQVRDKILQKQADVTINIAKKSPNMITKEIFTKLQEKYKN